MYAGRLETTQKEILKLTTAFLHASIKNSSLEFSIYGSGSQENEVKFLLNNCKNSHKVYFKGSVAPSEIQNVMLNHQVFTLMSDYEGMPIALMEAMACGLVPVCLYEESGIKEIILQGVNGLIVKNREEDYQDKLKTLVDDQLLWEKMSENAIQTIKTKYSSDITHKQWFELLNGYRNGSVKKVKIPLNMKLNGELLYYGDNRKPTLQAYINNELNRLFQKTRLYLRPRARLKKIFNRRRD
jgi:glycosyltransferase involved in cell wall biosynthesis